jgi:hypothetical protein
VDQENAEARRSTGPENGCSTNYMFVTKSVKGASVLKPQTFRGTSSNTGGSLFKRNSGYRIPQRGFTVMFGLINWFFTTLSIATKVSIH